MTAPLVPSHRVRAQALRFVLALLKKDNDVVILLVHELATLSKYDSDCFVLVLGDHTAMLARRRLDDPVGYFESWIALELQLAEDEDDPQTSQTGDL